MNYAKIAACSLAIGLSACGDKGSEFIGKWRHFPIDMRREPLLIERNGDAFLLTGNIPRGSTGKISGESLEVTWNQRGGCNLIMNKTTDHMEGCGGEFVRATD